MPPTSPAPRPAVRRRTTRTAAAVVALVCVLVVSACGDDAGEAAPTSTAPAVETTDATTDTTAGSLGLAEGEVRRFDLSDAAPDGAPGQHLYLQEVVIGPRTRLGTHFHDGIQIAGVRQGVLTYHVVSGSVQVTRADGTVETVSAPTVTAINAGESVVERADTVHYGENVGDGAVVITLAALVAEGGPVSTPVEE